MQGRGEEVEGRKCGASQLNEYFIWEEEFGNFRLEKIDNFTFYLLSPLFMHKQARWDSLLINFPFAQTPHTVLDDFLKCNEVDFRLAKKSQVMGRRRRI